MKVRAVLFAMVAPGLSAMGVPSMARPVHRVIAPPVRAAGPAVQARAERPVAARATGMIAQTGAARRSVAVRAAIGNGIAGSDFARPAARATVGGGLVVSGGIDGGTVHRRH